MEVEVLEDPDAVAARAAEVVAQRARAFVAERGRFTFAVSGGRTPWEMFERLRDEDMPWDGTSIYQVDERVAPPGDPDRNLTHLLARLPPGAAEVHPMPVDDEDLSAAATRYAASLPRSFDLVHLGLGPDGHTASLIPGDPALDVSDRDVALTGVYHERRRMTLTFPVLDRAVEILWLVTGAEKADALSRLREADESIPAARVRAPNQLVLCDRSAASD